MEGILLGLEGSTSGWGVVGGAALAAIAVVSCVLGYIAEQEKSGRRVFWAEWPIPESAPSTVEEEMRLAA